MRADRHSTTAAKIARGLLYLEGDPVAGKVLPDGLAATTADVLRAAGLLAPWHLRAYRSRWFSVLVKGAELASPGLMLHFALRKRVVEDEARAALAAGARQVLVIGAGFDVLCARLAAERPEVVFVEIDHPATAARKRAGVEGAGLARANLHLVAADLAERALPDVLAEVPAWDRAAPAYVVAEGLLMYLPAPAVGTLLDAVRAVTGPGSRFLLTWVPGDDAGRPGGRVSWVARTALQLVGERLTWGPRPAEIAGYLHDHGWDLREGGPIDLRQRYLEPLGVPDQPTDLEEVGLATRRD